MRLAVFTCLLTSSVALAQIQVGAIVDAGGSFFASAACSGSGPSDFLPPWTDVTSGASVLAVSPCGSSIGSFSIAQSSREVVAKLQLNVDAFAPSASQSGFAQSLTFVELRLTSAIPIEVEVRAELLNVSTIPQASVESLGVVEVRSTPVVTFENTVGVGTSLSGTTTAFVDSSGLVIQLGASAFAYPSTLASTDATLADTTVTIRAIGSGTPFGAGNGVEFGSAGNLDVPGAEFLSIEGPSPTATIGALLIGTGRAVTPLSGFGCDLLIAPVLGDVAFTAPGGMLSLPVATLPPPGIFTLQCFLTDGVSLFCSNGLQF